MSTVETANKSKPFLCRLGWHTSIFVDSAMTFAAERCNKCGEWVDQYTGTKVEKERELCSNGKITPDMSWFTARRIFFEELAASTREEHET